MVDGDMLNVIVNKLFVSVAERNLKKYDVIPLFYDANKAPPEMMSKEAQFHGLKRAHQFSNIGEISNMLTRLWNRDNPDREAAAYLTYVNNLRIDGAKTGFVNEYSAYPEIAKRINKATGGPNGRMPFFFSFSRNGRRDKTTHRKKKRNWAKPNNSTMNRICKAFDDIGNINMNWAGVPPFNWQMLMNKESFEVARQKNDDVVKDFCDLCAVKLSLDIQDSEANVNDTDVFSRIGIVEEHIEKVLIKKYGSIEACFPHITQFLFTGENFEKSNCKQVYWRIFGPIAVDNLRKNLENCVTCDECGMKIPLWVPRHTCKKTMRGFYECVDCGKICVRQASKQCRCAECQEIYRRDFKDSNRKKNREERKRRRREFITFLQ